MTQTLTPGNFGYGNKVKYVAKMGSSHWDTVEVTGSIAGRVADSDLYTVIFDRTIFARHDRIRKYMEMTFGIPNRHLPLQWGKYYGYYNECILPAEHLTLVPQ